MSQLLVAVKSSFPELILHDEVRGMWAHPMRGKAQVKFFLGRPTQELGGVIKSVIPTMENSYSPKSDEVILDCVDTPGARVWKTRAICQWAIDKLVNHILFVNIDQRVIPEKVWASNFGTVDYSGVFQGPWGDVGPREVDGLNGTTEMIERCYSWASGAFFLSKAAAFEVAEAFPNTAKYGGNAANDDLWVGQIIGPLVAKGDFTSMPLDESVTKIWSKI